MGQKKVATGDSWGCQHCGSDDHWFRECPEALCSRTASRTEQGDKVEDGDSPIRQESNTPSLASLGGMQDALHGARASQEAPQPPATEHDQIGHLIEKVGNAEQTLGNRIES